MNKLCNLVSFTKNLGVKAVKRALKFSSSKRDIHPGVSRHCQPLIPYSFTSSQGTFHSKQTTAYDAKMLGDATPGEDRIGLSVLNTVR
jgi:methyl coenzyme M reductase subunit D